MREVRSHVDCNAVQRHPLLHADTESGDLVFETIALFGPAHPYTNSILAALGVHVEGGQGSYDPFFQRGNEAPYVWAATPKIDHDIGHALSWSVIGKLASAAAFVDGKTRVDQVGMARAGAGGVERRVLQEPHEFSRPAGCDRGCPSLHGCDRVRVRNQGIADAPFDRCRSGRRWKSDCQCISRVNHSFTIP